MRGMKPGEALDYFWTYYKIHLMFLAIIIFFLVLILQANFGKRTELVYAGMLVDAGVSQEAANRAAEEFTDYLGLDRETQQVTMDAGIYAAAGGTVADLQKLMVSVAASEVDGFLTTPELLNYLLKGGALSDLGTVLPEETLTALSDRLWYADAQALGAWSEANRAGNIQDVMLVALGSEGMAQPVPVGVAVADLCAAPFDRPAELGDLIFSVAVTTRRQSENDQFLAFLQQFGGEEG